jgi:hypothetical protein
MPLRRDASAIDATTGCFGEHPAGVDHTSASGGADLPRWNNAGVQHRHERVYIETQRHRIAGLLTLPADGYRSRLSDFLNASERDFISLTDCVVELIGHDGPGTRHEFIAVSRNQIVLAMPEGSPHPA